jgi:hypothetical protein
MAQALVYAEKSYFSNTTGAALETTEIIGCQAINGQYRWHLRDPRPLSRPPKPVGRPQPVWLNPFSEKAIVDLNQRTLKADEKVREWGEFDECLLLLSRQSAKGA